MNSSSSPADNARQQVGFLDADRRAPLDSAYIAIPMLPRRARRRRRAPVIVPLLLGAAVGGVIGLAIINLSRPPPQLTVQAAPTPPVTTPPMRMLATTPASSAAVVPPPSPSPPLAPQPIVLTLVTIAQAQRDLLLLGFNPGKIDGINGKKTRAAISAFQKAKGLPADGELTPEVAAALRAAKL